jgi:drug/metabolite transporter (DMT)-like permease
VTRPPVGPAAAASGLARREGALGGLLLLGGLTLLWGGNWPAMKLALREIDPWTFRTGCLLLGGGGLLALTRAGGQGLGVPRTERGRLLVAAVLNITAWHLLSAYSLTLIPAGRGAIVAYTMPLWTVLFGWLLLGERLTRSRAAALGLGLAGLAVLVAPEARALREAPAGILLMLAGAASWALGTVLTKAARWTIPTAVLTGWQLVLGALPVAAGAALRWPGASEAGRLLASVGPAALAGAAYATLIGVMVCHWAWFRLVATLPMAVAAIGTLGIPIVGVFSSALVLGEPVGPAEVVALALVIGGLALLARGSRGAAESRPTPSRVSSAKGGGR